MKNNKIINLRFIAILLVVFGHSIILYSSDWNLYNPNKNYIILDYLKKIINIIQMPLFFSISGFLLYYTLQKKISFFVFFKDKFKRLIIPFLFFTFFWMIPIRLIIKFPGYNNLSIFEIFIKNTFLFIDNGHLWFLPTLFLIFLFMYFIGNFLIKFNKKFFYYLTFFIIFIIYLISYKIKINSNLIINVINYFPWCLLGFIINYNKIEEKKSKKILLLFQFIICLILPIIIKSTLIAFLCTTILIIIIYKISCDRQFRFCDFINKNSFGIYLFHSPLIYITYTYIPNYHPIIIIFINFFIFGSISILLTLILRKLKLNYIIGEKLNSTK